MQDALTPEQKEIALQARRNYYRDEHGNRITDKKTLKKIMRITILTIHML